MELSAAIEARSTLDRPRVEAGKLLGSRCLSCGAAAWPERTVCPHCGHAEMEEVAFEGRGTLVTFTTVWVPRPGLPSPYVLGQVDLDEGVRLFARGDGDVADLRVPSPVRLIVAADPEATPLFWFEPESDG